MRSKTAQALLVFMLLFLAGCGGSSTGTSAPPLIFPTQMQGTPGPVALGIYFDAITSGASPKSTISALNAADGGLRWTYQVHAQAQYTLNLESNLVFFGAADQKVYALDAGSSRVRWSVKLSGFPAVSGVADGVVYGSITSDASSQFNGGPLFALNASDGSVKWRSQIVGTILDVVDGVVYIGGSMDNTLYALNASDGSVKWHFQAAYRPILIDVEQGVVYTFTTAVNSSPPPSAFYALDASTGALKWSYPTDLNARESISLAGADNNAAYLLISSMQNPYMTNEVLALKASDGSALWHYQLTIQNRYVDSSMLDNGVVYLGANDGNLYALNASNGTLHWQAKMGNTFFGIDLVDSGIIYTNPVGEGITAVNANDGSIRWRYMSSNSVQPVTVKNGLLYAVIFSSSFSSDMHSYAIALKTTDGSTFWKYDGGATSFFPVVG